MPILASDLKLYGSAVMPDNDVPTNIGAAIATATQMAFYDVTGLVQAISSAAGDTTQTVTVSYRNTAGVIQTEVKTLNGTTLVTYAATMERLLKAIKSATTTGDVAIEAQTATRSNTAQAGSGVETIILDSGASASDEFYTGQVIRLTGGTGSGQIRQIIAYVGATKEAKVNRQWSVTPNATTTFRIAPGFYFEKSPVEATEVRRVFYDAAADVPGGSTRTYYEKAFFKNTHGTITLTSAQVKEFSDPTGKVTFALATAKDDTGDNGANNRQVAPSSGVTAFDSADKNVPGTTLAAGESIGVWLKVTLNAGDTAQNTTYQPRLAGVTI